MLYQFLGQFCKYWVNKTTKQINTQFDWPRLWTNSLTLTAFKSHSNRWHLSFIQRFNCYISILTHPWRVTSMISNLSFVSLVWHDVTWPQQIWHECHNTSNCHQTDITTLLANIKSIYKQTLYSIHVILQTQQLFVSPQYCKLHPITVFRLFSVCIFTESNGG